MKFHERERKLFSKIEVAILIALSLLVTTFHFSTTGFVSMGVAITDQNENIFYEVNDAQNVEFQITLTKENSYFSYNGTGGIYGGRDIGIYSNNITEKFILQNMGSTTIDVLIAAEDVEKSDGTYIDVGISGDFDIYILDYGWKGIPDNNNQDADSQKDDTELCIANNLLIGDMIGEFDFRVRGDVLDGNYTSHITITSYNSDITNPCSRPGEYVTP